MNNMTYKIKENAKNVWIRNNENTQDLSPLTDANSVYFNNGRTLEQELGKGAMESNVVTIDSTMSKVIDEAYDGVYESCVFKGKSLVNLGREIDSQYYNISGEGTQITSDGYFKIPYAGSENSHSVRLKFGLLEPLIKPDTVYSLIVEIVENTTQNARIGFTGHNNLSCVEPVDKNTNIASAVGTHVKLIKRRSEVTARQSDLHFCIWDKTNVDATKHIKFRYMILEGDWTNKELPPFFTGIGYAKMPILRNIGKNLYEGKDYQRDVEANKSTGDLPLIMSHVKLKKNTDYCISYSYETNTTRNDTTYGLLTKTKVEKLNRHNALYSYHHDGYEGNGKKGNSKQLTQARFNTGDFEYLYFGVNSTSAGQNGYIKYFNIQLEELSSPTPYESHKTNILRTSEEIVLRSLPNGVCDTYNARTGEYVKRIGERTLNGSEAWIANSGTDKQFEDVWVFHNQESLCNGTVRLCDKLQARENANENAEFIRGGGAYIFVYISKNKVQNHNANDFKTWLQSNPITVQYELAEPVTTVIEPSTIPFIYQNGHIILESGYKGQSLTPILEYTAITNRTGQVENVAKTIRQHEAQLTLLEKMLITNIIELDYNNTLMALNLKMDEVK